MTRAGTVAEKYINTINTGGPMECVRFWASEWCLVGGSITSPQDYEHLAWDFGVGVVFSFETEHDDDQRKIIPPGRLIYAPFPDNGQPVPDSVLQTLFDKCHLPAVLGVTAYVHCQQGRFRAPAMAWFLINLIEERDPTETIRRAKSDFDPNHTYVNCAREWLRKRDRRNRPQP